MEGIKRKLFRAEFHRLQGCYEKQAENKQDELVEIVRPVVERISDGIAQSIIEYNQGPPRALFA